MTYDEFACRKLAARMNGLGNIYRIPMEYVLQTVKPPQ